MITLLQKIVDLFVCWVETAVITVINLVVVALAALVSAVLALLPDMPDLPTRPAMITTGFEWVGYWFPIGYFLTVVTTVLVLYVAWLLVRIPLRWAKANPS